MRRSGHLGSTTARAFRESLRRRAPWTAKLYRRTIARLFEADRRPAQLADWARKGVSLRDEFGVAAYVFDEEGVWARDNDGLEWSYDPDGFLSAFGREYGERFDV